MKRIFLLVFMFSMFASVVYAECISGDCQNGQGTKEYENGSKYVGQWKRNIDVSRWHKVCWSIQKNLILTGRLNTFCQE